MKDEVGLDIRISVVYYSLIRPFQSIQVQAFVLVFLFAVDCLSIADPLPLDEVPKEVRYSIKLLASQVSLVRVYHRFQLRNDARQI